MWYLGWFWHALVHGQNPFTTTTVNYPYQFNLMLNTSILTEAVVFGPLVYVANSVFAFNVVVLASLLLSGLFGYSFLHALGARRWLAVLGGLLLEMSPFTVNQLVDGHINFSMSSAIILAILSVTARFLQRQRRPVATGCLIGVLCVAQFYTSLEMFATFTLMVLIAVVFYMLFSVKTPIRRTLTRIRVQAAVTALTVTFVLAAPGAWLFLAGLHGHSTPFMPRDVWVTDIVNLLLPTTAQWLHTGLSARAVLRFTGDLSEMGGYIGAPLVIGILWILFTCYRQKWVWVLFIIGSAATVLSFGPHLHIFGHITKIRMPWVVVERLPLLQDATAGRIMFYADVSFVTLLVVGLERTMRTSRGRLPKGIATYFLLIAAACAWMPTTKFWHQHVLPSSNVFRQNNFQAVIDHQPVAILVNGYWSFGYVMQALADSGYPFPVTNVYGFPYTSWMANGKLEKEFSNDFLFESDFSRYANDPYDDSLAVSNLRKYIAQRHPAHILWLQGYSTPLPPSLAYALTQVCGRPMTIDGSYLWHVPSLSSR